MEEEEICSGLQPLINIQLSTNLQPSMDIEKEIQP